ncbi:hypothetical protein [Mycolicibacterium sp.]|nr:hypothetical protein [Mycolicibacterium sp.]MCB1263923.1 hypothetical protein [Mycobacterium sp.]MCB1291147.1 hypothetical protein [Mycobacterium sp.]MCB9408450.1 hypothetical protein [Mycolicibacterium sp.]
MNQNFARRINNALAGLVVATGVFAGSMSVEAPAADSTQIHPTQTPIA